MKVGHHMTESAIVNLLRFLDPPSALIFCSTRQSVRHLEAILRERGFAAVALSGELSQHERNHALQALRDGRARVCVATDVAARGIDLPNLGLVIHADLPNDAEVLQHRSGRTGRAGRKGVSILLVPSSRRRRAEEMLNRARVDFSWSDPPSADDIRRLDQERLLQSAILTEPGTEDDLAMADALLAAHQPRDIAAAFVKMYRAQLPSPEDVSEPVQTRSEPRKHHEPGAHKKRERPDNAHHERTHDKPKSSPRTMQNGVWFKLTVGRERKADPKWLLPEICRQGEITKRDIGAIRVYETETRFEVDSSVAEKFAANVAARAKGGVRIFPAPDGLPAEGGVGAPPPRPHRDSEKHVPKPHGGKPKHKGFTPHKNKHKHKDRKPH
jgi:ATP-dependent RNA helicase DeaD